MRSVYRLTVHWSIIVTVTATLIACCTPVAADQAEPAVTPAADGSQATAIDQLRTDAVPMALPRPFPTLCTQGAHCNARIDCGYDSTQGGWQGVCVNNVCYCY